MPSESILLRSLLIEQVYRKKVVCLEVRCNCYVSVAYVTLFYLAQETYISLCFYFIMLKGFSNQIKTKKVFLCTHDLVIYESSGFQAHQPLARFDAGTADLGVTVTLTKIEQWSVEREAGQRPLRSCISSSCFLPIWTTIRTWGYSSPQMVALPLYKSLKSTGHRCWPHGRSNHLIACLSQSLSACSTLKYLQYNVWDTHHLGPSYSDFQKP